MRLDGTPSVVGDVVLQRSPLRRAGCDSGNGVGVEVVVIAFNEARSGERDATPALPSDGLQAPYLQRSPLRRAGCDAPPGAPLRSYPAFNEARSGERDATFLPC